MFMVIYMHTHVHVCHNMHSIYLCYLSMYWLFFIRTHTIYTHTVAPNFTVNPENLLAVVGDSISLTCSAQATPVSVITWEFNNGTTIIANDLFNINASSKGDVTTSVLSFIGREDLAGSSILMFRCVASNDAGNATSDTATVTIQSKHLCVYCATRKRIT